MKNKNRRKALEAPKPALEAERVVVTEQRRGRLCADGAGAAAPRAPGHVSSSSPGSQPRRPRPPEPRTDPPATCLSVPVPRAFCCLRLPGGGPSVLQNQSRCRQRLQHGCEEHSPAPPAAETAAEQLKPQGRLIPWHCMWLREPNVAAVDTELLRRKA